MALRGACARVARMPGAAERLESLREEMQVLASDGEDAAYFSSLFHSVLLSLSTTAWEYESRAHPLFASLLQIAVQYY